MQWSWSPRRPARRRPHRPEGLDTRRIGRAGRLARGRARARAIPSVTGRRAARNAGNKPPMKPIASAHFRPVHSSARRHLEREHDLAEVRAQRRRRVVIEQQPGHQPRRAAPPSSASSIVSSITETTTGRPRKPIARSVAISRARAATAAYMVLSAPNTAPIAMIDADRDAEDADQLASAAPTAR